MQIHCLGTTGYHPSETRHTSCYFLPADGIVLDAGTGIFRLAPLIQTDQLDILLSHAHLDHIAGLTFLLDILFQHPVPEVRVWGEAEKLHAIRTHLFDELVFPVPLKVKWHEIDPHPSFVVGNCGQVSVDWMRQDHPCGSVAYRLKWAASDSPCKTLIYATDTTGDASPEARQWMHGADLLMHECYFQDHEQAWALQTGHCWTTRAAEIARDAKVRKLLLTHISPLACDEDPVDIARARATFADATVAEDKMVVEF